MYRILTLLIIALTATACSLVRYQPYPRNQMDFPHRAETGRVSSAAKDWQDSNNDAQLIEPGQTFTLAEIDGPGRITHIWMTIGAFARFYPRECVIRMYWDGAKTPAVEAPLGDFFGVGHGLSQSFHSRYVANSSYGRAYNCYWPMPFRQSARITLTNDSPTHPIGLYWQVDYENRPVPKEVPYFHAQYRQENPPSPGKDYLLFEGKGKGHYVGTVLSVRMSQPGWFGEGDDRFFVDGATSPTLSGTGTEDYFNDAWAFRQFHNPLYGVSVWEGQDIGDRGTMYRWHEHSPVFFEESLKAVIEHKGNTFNEEGRLISPYTDKRPDFYSSVAYWYQMPPAKRFAAMPPCEERYPPYFTLEAEDLLPLKTMNPQKYALDSYQFYSGGEGLRINSAGEPQGEFEIPFQVETPGQYLVFLRVWPRSDSGVYHFGLNGVSKTGQRDFYATNGRFTDVKIGELETLKAGTNTIQAICVGANESAQARALFVDCLYLEPIRLQKRPEQAE